MKTLKAVTLASMLLPSSALADWSGFYLGGSLGNVNKGEISNEFGEVVIDTALPAFDEIRDRFDLADGSGEVSLIVTAYFLGMAVGQLPIGPLSDRFGRRPIVVPLLQAFMEAE